VRRRSFLALASGLLVVAPEPVRAYSFVGGWNAADEVNADVSEWLDRVAQALFQLRRLPGESDDLLRRRLTGAYTSVGRLAVVT
jgi:hypothetical protein